MLKLAFYVGWLVVEKESKKVTAFVRSTSVAHRPKEDTQIIDEPNKQP